jgi:hypothetical protein
MLVKRNDGAIGMDSRGRLNNGQYWRQAAGFGSGARYRTADKESMALFDAIIDSACWKPFTPK